MAKIQLKNILTFLFSLFLICFKNVLYFFSEKPSPPERLGVTNVTKDSVSLAWSKPEHDGGSRITSYFIEALEKGQQKWIKCAVVKTTYHVIHGLKQNADYFFRVSAENQAGLSDPKEMVLPITVKEQLGNYFSYYNDNNL